jgi:GMP synthase-like glutamine amidotransferase
MDVAVIASRFDPDTGYVGERLQERGVDLHFVWRNRPEKLHDVEKRSDLLILMPTGWTVLDADWNREIAAEKALVRRALDRKIPMLAICYGAHLVASVIGSPIEPCVEAEIGWVSVETNEVALCEPGPWFVFHRNSWIESSLPIEAKSIARSAISPQAFQYHRTLAVQFHPEATSEMIDRWLSEGADKVSAAGVNSSEVRAQSSALAESARERGHRLVDYFLEAVAGAT